MADWLPLKGEAKGRDIASLVKVFAKQAESPGFDALHRLHPLRIVAYTCNPSIPAMAVRGPKVEGHLQLHSKTTFNTKYRSQRKEESGGVKYKVAEVTACP